MTKKKKMNDSGRITGFELLFILTAIFAVLKLFGVVHWDWVWVFSPFFIAPVLLFVIYVLAAIERGIREIFK